jgi:hypothetical protein
MEHRYDKRFPADHKTLVFKNGMPVAIGRIHNLSRGGMFVKTDFHLADINQSLDIELISRGNNQCSDNHRSESGGNRRVCRTLVMHKGDEGLGLMLREDCEETRKNFARFFAEEFAYNAGMKTPAAVEQPQTPAYVEETYIEKDAG